MSKRRATFREDIRVKDNFTIRRRSPGGGDDEWRNGGGGSPPIKLVSNVHLKLKDPKDGRVVEKRDSHNIFLNYGRDWLAHLVGLDAGGAYFRSDRIKLMAFGIGGTAQQIASDTIRGTTPGSPYAYPGFPNDWIGGAGSGDPVQTDVDPAITALEWPVEVTTTPGPVSDYYDLISQPNTFPGTVGVIRFTAVLGLTEVSFGAHPSVPLSEIGLFTESVTDETIPPVVAAGLPAEKYMVAYNTFDTLSKTTSFVLEVDWELRFS